MLISKEIEGLVLNIVNDLFDVRNLIQLIQVMHLILGEVIVYAVLLGSNDHGNLVIVQEEEFWLS